ncbi:CARD- and ANK-domain containing inflammasome adapter protein [Aplochiton taeniatus]
MFKDFLNAKGGSDVSTNPYAIDVIRAKKRDLIEGISHTEDLLDLLVGEGVFPAAKMSIVLTMRTREEQNSRVLDILVLRGERACRKFFHPCLMLAEPDLYQRMKNYVGGTNEKVRDPRRQLIGYLLERDREGLDKSTDSKKIAPPTKDRNKPKVHNKDKTTRSIAKTTNKTSVLPKPGSIFNIIASGGELSVLEELLKDIDINTVNCSNETLLHVAAEHGQLSFIELLLRRGARLDLVDEEGRTALHRAALRGRTMAIKALIKAGAPIYCLDKQSKTPVHLAVTNGHGDAVKALVKEEARFAKNQTQDSFIHMVAKEDNPKLAEVLLQSGAAVDAKDSRKKTALFHAVCHGRESTVALLLKAGASVDREVIDVAIQLNQGNVLCLLLGHAKGALSAETLASALFSAVRKNQDAVISALIDSGADVNVCDKQGYTPLLLAAELGHTDAFRALVSKQAPVNSTLPDLSSALHLAVQRGSGPITQLLLEKGLDPNTAGPKAHTPLHLAAQHNRSALVELLIRAGAQVNGVAQDGLTPLHIASKQGHAEMVTLLLQGHADPGMRDRQGRTALHWAVSTQEESPIVGLLLSAGANPNITDKEKKSALHLAAMEGRVDAVTSLLSRKAKGGAKDMDGSTPLHYAAANGHAKVAAALLSSLKNKGVDERNVWRKTALHGAAERGHGSMVELLLRTGAKINAMDNSRDTPLHCAARTGHQEVVRRLMDWEQGEKASLHATNNVKKTPLQVAETGNRLEHAAIVTLLKRKMLIIK